VGDLPAFLLNECHEGVGNGPGKEKGHENSFFALKKARELSMRIIRAGKTMRYSTMSDLSFIKDQYT
jgi:hypothetical protein